MTESLPEWTNHNYTRSKHLLLRVSNHYVKKNTRKNSSLLKSKPDKTTKLNPMADGRSLGQASNAPLRPTHARLQTRPHAHTLAASPAAIKGCERARNKKRKHTIRVRTTGDPAAAAVDPVASSLRARRGCPGRPWARALTWSRARPRARTPPWLRCVLGGGGRAARTTILQCRYPISLSLSNFL